MREIWESISTLASVAVSNIYEWTGNSSMSLNNRGNDKPEGWFHNQAKMILPIPSGWEENESRVLQSRRLVEYHEGGISENNAIYTVEERHWKEEMDRFKNPKFESFSLADEYGNRLDSCISPFTANGLYSSLSVLEWCFPEVLTPSPETLLAAWLPFRKSLFTTFLQIWRLKLLLTRYAVPFVCSPCSLAISCLMSSATCPRATPSLIWSDTLLMWTSDVLFCGLSV